MYCKWITKMLVLLTRVQVHEYNSTGEIGGVSVWNLKLSKW
jgi:hypothetical protein